MVKKKNTRKWEKRYDFVHSSKKDRYLPTYFNKEGSVKHYKYIDENGKKQSIYVYVGVFPENVSRKKWFFRVSAVAKNGAFIGVLDSREAGYEFGTAEHAKETALKVYRKWLLNQPGVIYVK